MAVDAAPSLESSKPKLPEVAKPLEESSPSSRFYTEKSRVSSFASGIRRFFRGVSGEKQTGVSLDPEVQEMQALSKQLQTLETSTEAQLQANAEGNKAYAPFSPESIAYIFEKPNRRTYTTLTFESGKLQGDELAPTKRILYEIPEEYQDRGIRDIILKHRKDPGRFSGDGWDPDGAYSRVLIKDTETGQWKGWIDPVGYGSDKFAEPRPASDPENEVLHDWRATVGEVHPGLISVENVGKTELAVSNVHGLEVVFFPETEGVKYQQQIFSPGTEFVDLEDKHMREPRYGGGPAYGGKYPGAVALGGWRYGAEGKPPIDNDPTKPVYLDEQGRMHVKLEPGKKFVNLELAVGDTHPDGIQNKDGHTGTLGWAKIYAGLKSPGQEDTQYFMRNVNVPPAGVLAGGPEQADRIVQDGEEIVIDSRSDTSYLMGYRVAYKQD